MKHHIFLTALALVLAAPAIAWSSSPGVPSSATQGNLPPPPPSDGMDQDNGDQGSPLPQGMDQGSDKKHNGPPGKPPPPPPPPPPEDGRKHSDDGSRPPPPPPPQRGNSDQ